ncbi:hypothetical protein MP228_003201 [Amoeboaphelidium protococcarum]|nr:hypothetical protein MP228_003201 [Amoeboaphelidium protococcarum]
MVDSTAANTSAPPLPVQDYQDSGTYGTQSSIYNNNNTNNLMSRYGGNNYRYGLNGGYNSNISSYGAAAYSPYSSPYNSAYSTSYGYNSSPYGSYGYGNRYGGGYSYGMGGYNQQQQNMLQSQQGRPSNPLMVLEHAVQILSSVTHLLDSTIMATHSSFMGVIGLIEQVGVLKSIVGGVVGLKWLSTFIGLSSRDYQSHGQSTMRSALSDEFNSNNNNGAGGLNSPQQMQQRNSRKRSRFFRSKSFMIMVAFAVIFVIPWLMKRVQRRRQLQQTQQQEQLSLEKSQTTETSNKASNTLDITFPDGVRQSADGSQIEFARALYDFTARNQNEISFKKGDLIAVTFKGGDNSQSNSSQQNTDPSWWRGKKRQGHIGYFPSNYVSLIGKQVDISADQFITQSKGQQVQ